MRERELALLEPAAYVSTIRPLRRTTMSRAAVVGFDTEYTSHGARLLSFQLSYGDRAVFHRCASLTSQRLAAAVVELVGPGVERVELATYYAPAEMQHLPVWAEGVRFREYGSTFECELLVGRVALSLYDVSRWYGHARLADVAPLVGLAKLERDRRHVTERSLADPRFTEYALQDARIAERLLLELRERWLARGVDVLTYRTPAGAAAAAYRLRWQPDVGLPPSRVRKVALRGCWGARCEAFARGSFPMVHELDMASAYPRGVLGLGRLPRAGDWRSSRRWTDLESAHGFARVKFQHPLETQIPALPVLAVGRRERLIWPLRGESWCTLEEFRVALELGAKLQLVEAWYYKSGDDSLARCMEHALARRASSEGLEALTWKQQSNALIGKLKQSVRGVPAEELRRASLDLGIPFTDLLSFTAEELAVLELQGAPRLGSVWAPEWHGLILGYVRARLCRLMLRYVPLYCYGDSVWTFDRPTELPSWCRVVRSGPAIVARTGLAWLGSAQGDHVAAHGWYSRLAALAALQNGRSGRYRVRRALGLRESARFGTAAGAWRQRVYRGTLAWCEKRRLDLDGSTEPWYTVEHYARDTAGPSPLP